MATATPLNFEARGRSGCGCLATGGSFKCQCCQREQSLTIWRRIVSELVLLGMAMSWQDKEGRTAKAYFEWLATGIAAISDGSDPALLSQIIGDVGRVIRYDLVEGAQKLADDGVEPSRVRGLLGRAVQCLPSAIQDALHEDVQSMTLLRARVQKVITIGSLEVEPIVFFAALESAAQGKPATVKPATGAEYSVEVALPRVTFHGPSTIVIAPPEFESYPRIPPVASTFCAPRRDDWTGMSRRTRRQSKV